jgi:hypothetical protein
MDLDIIHQGKILDNEDEVEYLFSSPEQPIVIFVPTELALVEYKNLMTVALRAIDTYKREM